VNPNDLLLRYAGAWLAPNAVNTEKVVEDFENLPPGASFEVPPAGLVLGRLPEAGVRISSPYVKRDHARVWAAEGGIGVEDLRSTNGTTVNGVLIERALMRLGDVLCIAARYHFEVVRRG
jgi:pSer/pThr/pTyr-binding forkhead associated (FHA) protein